MDLSVIIPLYNERQNVKPLYSELRDALESMKRSYEIIFVDDGSKDGTLDMLREIKNAGDRVKVIALNRNFGQTAAIMAGIHNSQGGIIVTMDGDMQNDPHDIPALLSKLDSGHDIVSGWRKNRKDPFFTRILPSKAANWLISKLLKTSLHDYGCTLKAYRRETIKDIKLYGEMHRFIPAIASWKGAKIAELVVNHRPRTQGKTKYGLNRTINVMLDLLLVSFLSEYSTKPIRFFGGLGVITCILGFLSMFTVLYMKLFMHHNMVRNPLLLLGALFLLVSIQMLSLGFLSEINIRTYYESQNKEIYHIREII